MSEKKIYKNFHIYICTLEKNDTVAKQWWKKYDILRKPKKIIYAARGLSIKTMKRKDSLMTS